MKHLLTSSLTRVLLPKPTDPMKWAVTQEHLNWCKEHVGEHNWIDTVNTIYFFKEEDAIAFKLRFETSTHWL